MTACLRLVPIHMLIPVLAFVLACALALPCAAAGPSQDRPAPAGDQPRRVALLLEHEADAWSAKLRAGLEEACRRHGLEPEVVIAPAGSDQEQAFRDAARRCGLVLVASHSFHRILRDNAGNFRSTMFGCIDTPVRAPNVMAVSFADEQAAFLAGAAAAMLARHKAVPGLAQRPALGWLSGEESPMLDSQFNAFAEGAAFITPDVRVIRAILPVSTDLEAAAAQSRRLLDEGVGVLMLAAGPANGVALEQAQAAGIYVLGKDEDLSDRWPGHVLTNIIRRADLAVADIVDSWAGKAFRAKTIITRTLADGGVEVGSPQPLLKALGKNAPPELARRMGELRREMQAGTIPTRSLRDRTLCDCL